MSLNKYISLRKEAVVLQSVPGYSVSKAEANPAFFERFANDIFDGNVLPLKIWEPFAGHTGRSRAQDLAGSIGMRLISYDLNPADGRVIKADSTVMGPGGAVGGVFFHPPYFGTTLLSNDPRDLSLIADWQQYLAALRKTIRLANYFTVKEGLVCAIGRDYRHRGERIRLDLEYLRMFEDESFSIIGVMESEPDVALIFKKVET
jgi:hypothetical protein